jgi:hypothetical protein
VICGFSPASHADGLSDTLTKKPSNDSLFAINYRMLPGYAKYASRYKILDDVNTSSRPLEINYSLQNFLRSAGYNDSSLITSYRTVTENVKGGNLRYSEVAPYSSITEKELFYGVWRNQLVSSTSDSEIHQSIVEGTNTMIDMGFTDLARDIFPFITNLMEEQHLLNYDHARTKGFGKGSHGVVTSIEILHALGSQNSENKSGVCRDVHETGRQLMKTMCEVYYERFYPDKEIDFDDYIFLQSWMTQASQHVTVSLINPLDTKVIYELDWGRVIEKTSNSGYDNGRMYGNTIRIWQFNKETQTSEPIDFKRTQFGKILDEDILTADEYQQFNGIYDEEYYSSIRYLKNMGKSGNLNFSLGTYHPWQHYFLTSYYFDTRRKNITRFLTHSGKLAFQAALHEDTEKKELLYPQPDWQMTASLMSVPRVISKFETKKFRLTRNISFDAFLNQQLDIFFIISSFNIKDSTGYNKVPTSGDGNLSFSNGLNINYSPGNQSFFTSLTLQGRSCVLPKDIRLMSPNVLVLVPNLRFVTPAIDLVSNTNITLNERSSLSVKALAEFTNKDAILFSGSIAGRLSLSKNIYFVTSIGVNDQIKGMPYFWYPVSRKWIDFQFNYLNNGLSISLLEVPENQHSINISFRKYLR